MRFRLLLASIAASISLSAAEPAWGPAVGTSAPAFSLPDQDGKTRTLSSLLDTNGAILVFYRSADW